MKKRISILMVWVMALSFCYSTTFAGNGNNGYGNTNWKCPPEGNLFIQDVVLFDKAGKELKEQEDYLLPGETYFVQVYPAMAGSTGNGQAKGRDKVDTELYVYMGLDSSHGNESEWDLVGKVRTKVQILNDNQWERGLISFTVPLEAAGYRAYLKAVVDPFQEVCETSAEDNVDAWTEFWFPVQGEPDFAKTGIGLTSGALAITEGDRYDVTMKLESQGRTPHARDFLSGFFYRGPKDLNWKLLESNLTLARDTLPGSVLWKKTGQFTAAEPGTHQIMGCADNLDTVPELSESNNCIHGSFLVKPKLVEQVDLKIYLMKLTEGTAVTRGRYFHPRVYMKNYGSQFPKSSSVVEFKFSGPGTGGQWVKCAERTTSAVRFYPLCTAFEQVDDNVCRAPNVPGTYTVRACADAYNQVAETNEENNCYDLQLTVK